MYVMRFIKVLGDNIKAKTIESKIWRERKCEVRSEEKKMMEFVFIFVYY